MRHSRSRADKRTLELASHRAQPLLLWAQDRLGNFTLIEDDLEQAEKDGHLYEDDNNLLLTSIFRFVKDTQAMEVDPSDPTL